MWFRGDIAYFQLKLACSRVDYLVGLLLQVALLNFTLFVRYTVHYAGKKKKNKPITQCSGYRLAYCESKTKIWGLTWLFQNQGLPFSHLKGNPNHHSTKHCSRFIQLPFCVGHIARNPMLLMDLLYFYILLCTNRNDFWIILNLAHCSVHTALIHTHFQRRPESTALPEQPNMQLKLLLFD